MGEKISLIYGALCSATFVLQIIGSTMKWHFITFYVAVVFLFRMETGLLISRAEVGATILCGFTKPGNPYRINKRMCERLEEGAPLQAVAQEWCAPAIYQFFPGPCDGFSAAYIGGIVMMISLMLNWILLSGSLFLLWGYMKGDHKQRYRQFSLALSATGTLVMLAALLFYSFWVVQRLDGIAAGGIGMALSANQGTGISYGFWIVMVSMVFQLTANLLFFCIAKGDELSEEDRQLMKAGREVDKLYSSLEAPAPLAPQPAFGAQPMYGGMPGMQYQPTQVGYGAPTMAYMPPPSEGSFGLPPATTSW
jgi:hypothetical protein